MKIMKVKTSKDIPENYTGIVEVSNGTKFWFLNGKYHREDGPAVEYEDGTKCWFLNGEYHREHGPAVDNVGGTKLWYLNGKRHREDGPAVEWNAGIIEYWLNGKELNKEKIENLINLGYPEKTAIKLSNL